ncbi:MAG: MlaD family protein [Myxococcota bacterium]
MVETGRRRDFLLGMTVGAIVAAAVMFSIYYVPRKGLALGRDAMPFTVVLEEAHGLHPGSPVLVRGVEAGEVVDVRVGEIPDVGWRVLATAELFDAERYAPMLHTDSIYSVARSGLLGEMTLAITPGGGGPSLEPGMLVGGSGPASLESLVSDLAHVADRLADFTDGDEPGDPSLRRTFLDLQSILRNLRDFSEKLPR